jgi:hypothetical protein
VKTLFRIVVLVCALAIRKAAAQSIDWQSFAPFSTTSNLNSVAYGDGVFVAGGSGLLIHSLNQGASWSLSQDFPAFTVKSIAFANHRFVAVGTGIPNQILTSTNGLMWTSTPGPDVVLYSVVYGNGRFIATGGSGTILYSSDGLTWNTANTGSTDTLSHASFGNGSFLVAEKRLNPTALTFLKSTDGEDWVRITTSAPNRPVSHPCQSCNPAYALVSLAYGNGTFVAEMAYFDQGMAALYSWYMKSTDGVNWQWSLPDGQYGHLAPFLLLQPQIAENTLFFVNNRFVHLFPFGLPYIQLSSDSGGTWISQSNPYNQSFVGGGPFAIAASDSSVVTVGKAGFITSGATAINLALYNPLNLGSVSAAAANDSVLVVAGPAGLLASSPASFGSFTTNTLPEGASSVRAVRYASGNFVAAGAAGTIIRSSNGSTWTKRLSNTTSDLLDIAYGSNLWVAVGQNGTITTSPDASFFTLMSTGTQVPLRGVAYGNGLFVAVGNDGAILRSSDGQNWTVYGTDQAETLNSIAYGNGKFVAVGVNGTVHTSTNGVNWEYTPILGAGQLARVAFAMGYFAAVQEGTNKIYLSTSGASWIETTAGSKLTGVDPFDQGFFVGSAEGQLWRGLLPAGPSEMRVYGFVNASRQFILVVDVPQSGQYRILSAPSPDGPWDEGDVITVDSHAEWTSPILANDHNYYRVRKE